VSSAPLVSVIIPVYNVKPYLRQCVESVCAQTYGDLEIIVVDDGSTDGSGELCNELGGTDSRITVLHKENGGLADARNFGLRHAHGEWISFVDSDDWVSPVFIEVLLNAALGAGCAIAALPRIRRFQDGSECPVVLTIDEVPAPTVVGSAEVQQAMLYQAMDTAAQNRLYARETLGDDPFPKGLYYEDLASVYRIVHTVDKLAVLDCEGLYAYRQRSTSILHQTYRHVKAESALHVSDQLYRDISAWYPQLATAAASRCFSVCRMVFAQVPLGHEADESAERDRQELWRVLKSYRGAVVRDEQARKRERLAAAIACLGEGPFSVFCQFCRRTGRMR
jgi:glycosyltransferase involved in cell wall biosynthesis